VIAVDLNSNRLGRHRLEEPEKPSGEISEWKRKLQENLGAFMPDSSADEPKLPSILDVITSSINIMQERISRSRMSGDPPDVIVSPRLAGLGLLDFHRSKEAIAEGARAMEAALPDIEALLKK
jgi:NTE family protein